MSAAYVKWADVEKFLDHIEILVSTHTSPRCGSCQEIKDSLHAEIDLFKTRQKLAMVEPDDSLHHQRLQRKRELGLL
jgi:hypothetical protein